MCKIHIVGFFFSGLLEERLGVPVLLSLPTLKPPSFGGGESSIDSCLFTVVIIHKIHHEILRFIAI